MGEGDGERGGEGGEEEGEEGVGKGGGRRRLHERGCNLLKLSSKVERFEEIT